MKLIRKSLRKTFITYKREIEMKPKKNVKVVLGITFFVVLLFGVFGIRPATTNLILKNKKKVEYRQLEIDLKNKIHHLKNLEEDLQTAEPYLDSLETVIPSDENMQDYLKSFVANAAKSGFILNKFSRGSLTKDDLGKLALKMTLSGDLSKLNGLIADLENMDRVTTINKVTAQAKDFNTEIKIDLVTYFLESN